MGQLSADKNGARQGLASATRREANAWALKTRQTEGPRGPERRKAVGNVGKPSGSRRKRQEDVGKTSGSRRKRRESVGNVGKPSETSGSRRERQEDVGKPSETGSRRNVGKPSESRRTVFRNRGMPA